MESKVSDSTRRITIVKTFALSTLNHLFLALPTTEKDILKAIEAMFYNFIWKGKPDKIKRETIAQKYLDRGLNMLNLDTFVRALKSTWIRRLYLNPKAPWATLATTLLGPLNRLFLLGSSYSTDIARKMGNKFWIDTLRSWSALTEKLGVKNKDLSLPIWNNTNFSNFFLPRWYNAGIVSIGDILNANGDILTETELARTF